MTWQELLTVVMRMSESERRLGLAPFLFKTLVKAVPILPYDHETAFWHAQERSRLMKGGVTPPIADGQIAAVSAVNNLILGTHNTDDCTGFSGLRVEN